MQNLVRDLVEKINKVADKTNTKLEAISADLASLRGDANQIPNDTSYGDLAGKIEELQSFVQAEVSRLDTAVNNLLNNRIIPLEERVTKLESE